MKRIINQHPFRVIIEVDDTFAESFGIDESDMAALASEWDKELKAVAIQLHAIKAQREGTKAMEGEE